MLIPFHMPRKVCHQAISARAELLRWTQWSSPCTVAAASIRLRKNALPGLTTVTAWCRRPSGERRSLFFTKLQGVGCSVCLIHPAIVAVSQHSLSWGRWTCCCRVPSSTPRKVNTIEGPSVLSSTTGNPNSSQRARVIASDSSQADWSGGPRTRESSK